MHERISIMKKKMKGIIRAALALSMCLTMPLSALPAAAAENEMPDPERIGSISITFTDPETKKPVTGDNRIALYKVADVKVENGFKFVYVDDFADAGEVPAAGEELNADLAEKLSKIAKEKGLDPDYAEQKIDENGNVTFTDLKIGLYLAVQTYKGSGNPAFTISPFLISIPNKSSDGKLVYDVDASPKVEVNKETTPTPPPEKHKPPRKLPQTGQLWWPVMTLGIAGAALVVFGMIRKSRNK